LQRREGYRSNRHRLRGDQSKARAARHSTELTNLLADEVYGVSMPEFLLGTGEGHLRVYEGGNECLEVRFNEVPSRLGLDAVGEKAENMILAFFRQPDLARDVELDLVQENLDDLRGEGAHKTLSEDTILLLQGAGELGRITVSSVEAAKGSIRPLLGLPPFASLPFVLVYGDRILGNLEVDDLEEQPAPWDQALVAHLVGAKLNECGLHVRLEDVVKKRGDFLGGSGGRR